MYTDLQHYQKLEGNTLHYNPYEEIGIVKNYIEKSNLRYKNQELSDAIIEFIYTYKDFFINFDFIIENVNTYKVLLDYTSFSYPQQMLIDARIFSIFADDVSVKKCLNYDIITNEEDYIKKIKKTQCALDYILLYIKFNKACVEKDEKIESTLYKCYDTLRKLSIEFKKYKQRKYDRQHIALLHKTKLPNDISNYIIKEFL